MSNHELYQGWKQSGLTKAVYWSRYLSSTGMTYNQFRCRVYKFALKLEEETGYSPEPLSHSMSEHISDYPVVKDDAEEIQSRLRALLQLDRHIRVLVVSDEHLPDHDPRAIYLNVAIARHFQPDVIVYNGDTFDFSQISRFAQDRRLPNRDIFSTVRPHWRRYSSLMAKAAPNALRILIDGNHNARVESFANLAWQFGDTIEEAYAALVREDMKTLWINGKQELDIGNLFVHHGTRAGENAAKLALDKDLGGSQSVIQGHTHGVGKYVKRVKVSGSNRYRIVTSLVVGYAGKSPASYQARETEQSRWIQGCAVGHVNPKGDDVHLQEILYHEMESGSLVAAMGAQVFFSPN